MYCICICKTCINSDCKSIHAEYLFSKPVYTSLKTHKHH